MGGLEPVAPRVGELLAVVRVLHIALYHVNVAKCSVLYAVRACVVCCAVIKNLHVGRLYVICVVRRGIGLVVQVESAVMKLPSSFFQRSRPFRDELVQANGSNRAVLSRAVERTSIVVVRRRIRLFAAMIRVPRMFVVSNWGDVGVGVNLSPAFPVLCIAPISGDPRPAYRGAR